MRRDTRIRTHDGRAASAAPPPFAAPAARTSAKVSRKPTIGSLGEEDEEEEDED